MLTLDQIGISEADWNQMPAAGRVAIMFLLKQNQLLENRTYTFHLEVERLKTELERLKKLELEIAELRERLGQNSQNSSKPPSSDPPSVSRPNNRQPTGRKRGGQPGHQGRARKLLPPTVLSKHAEAARVKVKGGREGTIPFPNDVRQAIDHYLKLDAARRRNLHSDGDDAFIFQPLVNLRTLKFDNALSARHICETVNRWACFAGLNKGKQTLSPHDLRRRAVTRALSMGFSYRQVLGFRCVAN